MRQLRMFTPIASFIIFLIGCTATNTSEGTVTIDSFLPADTAKALPETQQAVTATTETSQANKLDSAATLDQTMAYMEKSPDWEKYSQGILPAMVSDHLDYARRLLRSHHKYFIVADKGSMNVVLFDRYGREVKSYPMACSRHFGAKHRHKDNRTPEGYFTAGGIFDSSEWLYTNDEGYTSPVKGVYGPRFIRINPASNQVGIHGTNAPNSPGKRCSHGCMRLRNDNILDLVKYVSTGMPVIINPSDRDQAVNRKEGYRIPQIHIGKPQKIVGAATNTDQKAKGKIQPAKTDTTVTESTTAATDSRIDPTTTQQDTPVDTPEAVSATSDQPASKSEIAE